jgi:hypothetical protein
MLSFVFVLFGSQKRRYAFGVGLLLPLPSVDRGHCREKGRQIRKDAPRYRFRLRLECVLIHTDRILFHRERSADEVAGSSDPGWYFVAADGSLDGINRGGVHRIALPVRRPPNFTLIIHF